MDESARLRILADYGVMDTDPDATLDEIVALASAVCGTPVALISLVDDRRQWFKAKVGTDAQETPREVAFCAHAIAGEGAELFTVNDARADARFAANPLVRNAPNVVFYAGAPLVAEGGAKLGTLCVIDREPRELTAVQRQALATLSKLVVQHLERRREAAHKRTSEAWHQAVLTGIGDGVVTTDATGRVTFMNPVAEKLTGWSEAEAQGQPMAGVFRILHAHTRVLARSPVEQVLRDGVVAGLDDHTVLVRRDGTEVAIDDSAAPLRSEQGALTGVVLVFRDITARKQAEAAQARLALHQRLVADVGEALTQITDRRAMLQRCAELLVEHLGAALGRIWLLDAETNTLRLEGSAGLYTHLDGAHGRVPVGQFKIGLIAQERQPHLTNAVQSDPRVGDPAWAKREGLVSFAGYPMLVGSTLVGVVALFAREPLADDTLDVLQQLSVNLALGTQRLDGEAEQVRARQRVEVLAEQLRQREAQLRLVLSAAGAGTFSLDLTSGTVTADPRHHALLGTTPDRTAYEDRLGAVHAEDRERVRGDFAAAAAGERDGHLLTEFRVGVAGQSTLRWVEARGQRIQGEQGAQAWVVGTSVDITARKTIEGERRRQAEFEKQLIGIVSHDLRNPLNVIGMAAKLLTIDGALGANAAKVAQRLQSSSGRASRLVSDLLDFTQARLGSGLHITPRPGDLHALTRTVLGELEVSHPGRRMKLTQEGDGRGEWDADRLSQVVQNLVTNALKYSPEDSQVDVRTQGEGDSVWLSVHNLGAPIPVELQASIFEPMKRGIAETNRTGRSIGLGLYIVKLVVDAHRGAISVQSTESAGTTFTVQLPRKPAP